MIRLVIADDDPLVRTGLGIILNADPDLTVVAEAGDGAAAVDVVRRERPDVVLLDVRMPGTDGLTAARTLLAEPAPWKIVMLTTFDLDEYVYAALRAGASGFLLKDIPPERLVSAVRHVLTGDVLLAPTITTRLVAQHIGPATDNEQADILAGLTAREREVLALIGEGLSNAEIAGRLVLGEATVKTHVGRVFAKLGLRDRVQAVIAAYRTGLAPPPPRRDTRHGDHRAAWPPWSVPGRGYGARG
ncbi:response regulator transcription factor [Dactylosporangium sp. NPDC049140]|uniref:response regulator transcription factor n=1 Tax=Dactylosporangium sp. NPDC049140 TaxID=3155647 RepID=UPI0033C5A44D